MRHVMRQGLQAATAMALATLAVAAMVTLGCAGTKAPAPAAAGEPALPEMPLPSRVQAVYFPADSRPLDKASCGAWGEWVICFGSEPPTVSREECQQKGGPACARYVMGPLVCRHADFGESPCQIIMATFPPRKNNREEVCHVVGTRSLRMSIRCPERLRLGDAEVRRMDLPTAVPAISSAGPAISSTNLAPAK